MATNKLKIKQGPFKIQLLHFAECIGAEFKITTYSAKESVTRKKRVTVNFKGCDIIQGHMQCGKYGDATTLNGALKDYANQIAGEILRFNANSLHEKEIIAPINLIHINHKL